VDDDVQGLGLLFTPMPPPPGFVIVTGVGAGSWAEREGFELGFIIVSVNGEDVAHMSRERFVELLKQRPLRFSSKPPS